MADYLRNQLLSLAKSAPVAAAASIQAVDWPKHCQWYTTPWVGPVNVGRLPLLLIAEQDVQYQHEMQPDHGGTRTARIGGLVVVRCFGAHRTEQATQQAQAIFLAYMRLIRSNNSALELGSDQRGPMEPTRYGLKMPFEFDIQTTYNNDYEENPA